MICHAAVFEILAWLRGESVRLSADCISRGTLERGPIRLSRGASSTGRITSEHRRIVAQVNLRARRASTARKRQESE